MGRSPARSIRAVGERSGNSQVLVATLGAMRVVVTGGSGFIGSHVVDRLLAGGHRPLIFDAHRSVHHPAVAAVTADLADLGALCDALRGADAVIHLAAAADVHDVVAD